MTLFLKSVFEHFGKANRCIWEIKQIILTTRIKSWLAYVILFCNTLFNPNIVHTLGMNVLVSKIWKIYQLERTAAVWRLDKGSCDWNHNYLKNLCLLGKSHLKYGRLLSSSASTSKVPGEKALDSQLLRCSCSLANGTWVLQKALLVYDCIPSFLCSPLWDWCSEWGRALCQINTTENMTKTLPLTQIHMHLWHWWSPEREIQCAIMWREEYEFHLPW